MFRRKKMNNALDKIYNALFFGIKEKSSVFSFKKRVRISMSDFDKLVDEKTIDLRDFMRLNMTLRDNDVNFGVEQKVFFEKYLDEKIRPNICNAKEKDNRLSPMGQIILKAAPPRKSTYKYKIFMFFKRTQRWFRYVCYLIVAYRQIRKVKKTFRVNNAMATNLIRAAEINKRMMANETYSVVSNKK